MTFKKALRRLCGHLRRFFGSSGAALGRLWGGCGAALGLLWGGSGAALGAYWRLVGPKWPQVAVRIAPGGRQVGPRGPKRPPQGRQELGFGAPKWPQEGIKSHQEWHNVAEAENLKIDDPLNENA